MSYHDGLNAVVDKWIKEEPQRAQIYHDILVKLKKGFFPYWYIDMIMQTNRTYTFYDAAHFIEIHHALACGDVLYCAISVKTGPGPDKAIEENNKILSTIAHPFGAQFIGGPGLPDGYLWWDSPIKVGQILIDGTEKTETIYPNKIPLEVGYTKPTTTWLHLRESRAIARWPYDRAARDFNQSAWVYALFLVNDERWTIEWG